MKNITKYLIKILLLITLSLLIYFIYQFSHYLIFWPKYWALSKKELTMREEQLEHNINNLKKNIDSYILIKNYIVNNDILSIRSYNSESYIKITYLNNKKDLICKENANTENCMLSIWKNVYNNFIDNDFYYLWMEKKRVS